MADYWWRSWHGAPMDHKWSVIAARSGVKVGIVSAIAWALFDYASQQDERGTVAGFDVETYAVYSGFSEDEINAVIRSMTDKGIIADGILANWDKRQPKSESEVSRVQEYRRKKAKAIEEYPEPLQDVTECYEPLQDVTKNYTDTDTDTDTEYINMPVAEKSVAEKSQTDSKLKLKKEIPKKEYGEFKNVRLTDDEYEKLKSLFPSSWSEWIEKLSCWKKSKNKTTSSDYATIRNWTRREAVEKPQEKSGDQKWERM